MPLVRNSRPCQGRGTGLQENSGRGLFGYRICLILAFVVLVSSSLVVTAAELSSSSLQHQGGTSEIKSPPLAQVYPSLSYDEQVGVTFRDNFSSLAFNVTAVAQSDPGTGVGPAYLLNGVTDAGLWYQVGLSYNWPDSSGGPTQGFRMNYEVFDPSYRFCNGSIFPATCGGGVDSLTVYPGDIVQLSLRFSNDNVEMRAVDWNTGSTDSESYPSAGGSQFLGLDSPANVYGFFTGLMTEQYFSAPFYGAGTPVIYRQAGLTVSSATMWMDEFNANTFQPVFSDQSPSPIDFSNTVLLQYFTSHGTAEASSGTELVTGLTPIIFPSIAVPALTTGQQGELASIGVKVEDPSGLVISITSFEISSGFGLYNTTSSAPTNIIGNSTFTTRISIPSSLAVGNYTLRIVVKLEVRYLQIPDWIAAQPISANSTIDVIKSSPPTQATSPPPSTRPPIIPPLPGQTPVSNPSTVLNPFSLAREVLLSSLLAEVAAAFAVLAIVVHRRSRTRIPPLTLAALCASCGGAVTQNMLYCPKCGTLLTPPPIETSSPTEDESLGKPSN